VEAHHDDYGQPLAIRWLCRKCHRAWHQANKVPYGVAPAKAAPRSRTFVDVGGARDAIAAITNDIRTLCQSLGVTEMELASRIGCSRALVSIWFSGGFRTIKAVSTAARALGFDVRLVLSSLPANHSTASSDEQAVSL